MVMFSFPMLSWIILATNVEQFDVRVISALIGNPIPAASSTTSTVLPSARGGASAVAPASGNTTSTTGSNISSSGIAAALAGLTQSQLNSLAGLLNQCEFENCNTFWGRK